MIKIAKHDIATLSIIIILLAIIGILYFDDYFSDELYLVDENIEHELFDVDVQIINPNREFGVAPNDELIYFAFYKIKSEEVKQLNPIIEIKYRDKPAREIKFDQWISPQDDRRFYETTMLVEDLGHTAITYKTEVLTSNSSIVHEHDRQNIIVKTISELQQDVTKKENDRAFIVTAIIGSITAFAILGTYFTAKNNSRLLEEQKNIMKENYEKQVELSETENQLSKKHTEFLAMLEIMKIFNNDENGRRRDLIYRMNRNKTLYNNDGEIAVEGIPFVVSSVRGTFDNMGKLVHDGYVDKEQFLSMYCGSVIRMYKVLKSHIEFERKNRPSQHFATYFEEIFNESRKYWKEHFPNDPEPEPY